MTRPKVLFVDDQKSARELFLRGLDADRFEAAVAISVAEAEELLVRDPQDVVVTDLRMPGVDGLEGLERFHKIDSELPVILITAFGTVETAVEAMKLHAFDYIRKPFDPSELEIVISRALEHRSLLQENARLRDEVARHTGEGDFICRSVAMKPVMDLVHRVAPTDFSVLILGESGTGKDMLARYLHESSNRNGHPFISINCSAIPEHLLESELFGHVKGAFSGATSSRPGFFSEADGGTLFLDEIGDMSANLQPKLLRVLQNGEYYPVGSRSLSQTDVRLICASNKPIRDLVREGRFREDLYYRIHTVRLALPPLRERSEDIPLLATHFLGRVRPPGSSAPEGIMPAAMRCLLEYSWPGNVRELAHVIERAFLVCDSDVIRPADLPGELRGEDAGGPAGGALAYKKARTRFERAYFTEILALTDGRIQAAAEIAGIHRSTLYEKLARLDIHFEKESPPSSKHELAT